MTPSLEVFEEALNEVKRLTEEKQELLEVISKQERSIQLLNKEMNSTQTKIPTVKKETGLYRLEAMIKESNEALKRYNQKLRKEIEKYAEQKQSKRKQA
tara:strand:+ start:1570 stop:1866 length:297 start_codon:yes stop_codon:yes gene_type:complete